MKYKVNNEEKELIIKFQNMRIPSIFKTDNTDRILFVEDLSFFIANKMLKGQKISKVLYRETIADYESFIINTVVSNHDEYTLEYFNTCVRIVEIMKKYCLQKN